MRIKSAHLVTSVAVLLVLNGCGKKDGSSSAGTEETSGTVVSGASGPWRTTVPADTTPPVENSTFWGKAGSRLGTIALNLKYPSNTADYAKIEVRRLLGKTPPADCATGDVVKTITDFTVTAWEDTGLYPGGIYSYVACLSDAASNSETAYGNATVTASTEHRMFATSETFDGNLAATYQEKTFTTGLEGADYRCNYLAGKAGLTGVWKALMGSSAATAAYDRVPIYGPVYNLAKSPELLAESKGEFWGGRLQHAVGYDEAGTAVTTASGAYVWTGSYASGANSDYSCSSFTTNSVGPDGFEGDATDVTDAGAWIVRYVTSCSTKNRLYCVESYEGTVSAPTLAGVAGTGSTKANLTVTFPADTTAYGSVRVLRQPGKVLDNPSCTETYPGTKLVKLYSSSTSGAFTTETLTDDTGAEGYYNYLACVFDTSGNLMATSTSSFVSLGTSYKLAFVTSQSFDGNLGGVAGANTKCAAAATAASLSGTWKAVIADSTHDIFNNIGSGTANIYDLAGNFLAASYPNFASYTNVGTNAVATDETGAAVAAGTKVWSGSYGSGSTSGSHCTDWSTNGSGTYGNYGETKTNYGEWLYYSSDACNNSHRLYCVQN